MNTIDTTSQLIPQVTRDALDVALQNVSKALQCKTTAELEKFKEALENAISAITTASRDIKAIEMQPTLIEVEK